MFEQLLARLPDLELAADPATLPRRRANFISGLESMPVHVQPVRTARKGRAVTDTASSSSSSGPTSTAATSTRSAPTSPTTASTPTCRRPAEDVARGPAQIAARLRLGLEPLAGISHDIRVIVCEGDTVVTEHVEHWEWPTGERASLPFVSMQQLRDGKIVRWWDYWDLATLMNTAPAWWVEHIMSESARVGLREP